MRMQIICATLALAACQATAPEAQHHNLKKAAKCHYEAKGVADVAALRQGGDSRAEILTMLWDAGAATQRSKALIDMVYDAEWRTLPFIHQTFLAACLKDADR